MLFSQKKKFIFFKKLLFFFPIHSSSGKLQHSDGQQSLWTSHPRREGQLLPNLKIKKENENRELVSRKIRTARTNFICCSLRAMCVEHMKTT